MLLVDRGIGWEWGRSLTRGGIAGLIAMESMGDARPALKPDGTMSITILIVMRNARGGTGRGGQSIIAVWHRFHKAQTSQGKSF